MDKRVLILLFLLLCSFLFNSTNNRFSPYYHVDEIKKITFISENCQDFKHPLLMLQAPRLISHLFGVTSIEAIAAVGRTCNAFYGALIPLVLFVIARRFLQGWWQLLPSLIAATSPIIVIHAHYIKEDILLTLTLLLVFAASLSFKEKGRPWLLAIAVGLAMSSKYVGCLALPYALGLALFSERKVFNCFWILAISSGIFAIINYPLFSEFATFENGASRELRHALEGHGHRGVNIPIYASEFWFGFHYFYSLIPGLSAAITGLATVLIVWWSLNWKKLPPNQKLLLGFPLAFYAVSEISPLKAFPDFMRYVLPVAPFCALFVALLWQKMASWRILNLFFVVALAYTAYDSAMLVYHLDKDTREEAIDWLNKQQAPYKGDQYALNKRGLPCVSTLDLIHEKAEGTVFLASSSFFYERIALASQLKAKTETAAHCSQNFALLFQLPCKEIKPAYKSFAFSNPSIRIIDVRQLSD